jgi:hypothetical protein
MGKVLVEKREKEREEARNPDSSYPMDTGKSREKSTRAKPRHFASDLQLHSTRRRVRVRLSLPQNIFGSTPVQSTQSRVPPSPQEAFSAR